MPASSTGARLSLLHPLKSMLASPVADEAEALRRLGAPVWVEDKYDGIRAQLHRQGDEVRLFSRDLNDISGGFPEVVEAARSSAWDGILDGELLAWKDGAVLPFLQLQTRIGRKKPSAEVLAAVPVIYVAFDALALGEGAPPEPLLREPLRERRRRLEALGLPETPGFGLSALVDAADEVELERIFGEAQERGNEGLMLKDPQSIYRPGRRGLRLVEAEEGARPRSIASWSAWRWVTVVVTGCSRTTPSPCIDDRPGATEGALVTVGKAYSGLTDAEIAEMTRWFEAHTLERYGRYRVVEPSIVVEIAFDVVHASSRHKSGYALRFPRIVRIRRDKPAAEIDRLSTVAALHERLQVAGRYGVLTSGGRTGAGGDPS